jgi:hypothetical protein
VSTSGTYARRRIRELLNALSRVAAERNVSRLLVTSVGSGDGKTMLCKALYSEAALADERRIAFVSQQYLERVTPDDLAGKPLVIIDGPASIEVDGLSDVPDDWRKVLDGVILVVVKRDTPRDAIEEVRRWLDTNHLPIVAVVWNEYLLPPFGVQLDRFRTWFGRVVLRRVRKAPRTGRRERPADVEDAT